VISANAFTLADGFENGTLTGSATGNIVANNAANVLTGNSGNNQFSGRGGNDSMSGGAGDDSFIMSMGGTSSYDNDTIDGGTGVDVIEWASNEQSAIAIDLSAGTASGGGAGGSGTISFTGIENAWTGAFNDGLTGDGNANFLWAGAGNDTLTGGAGNDRLEGAAGSDRYLLGRGHGADTLWEDNAQAGDVDVAQFLSGVARDQLWFQQSGNNLVVSIIGTSDSVTVQDWYVAAQRKLERIETATGDVLMESQVQNLVNAMAAFTPPAPGQTTLPTEYAATLNPVIAANWQ